MRNTSCRMCKKRNLETILDLGFHPPSDAFLTNEELLEPETYYPLQVMICSACGLWQLSYIVDPKILYQKRYPYDASTTKTGREHFFQMARSISDTFSYPNGSLAIDIGSNIGILLQGFKNCGFNVLGVDPAPNIAAVAVSNGIETITDFFSHRLAKEIKNLKGEASVITGTNVFAHVNDLDDLMHGVTHLLAPRGIFVIEAPYLVELVRKLEYDTIYHEHLSYISIRPLAAFFNTFGLDIINAEQQKIHGGTLRIFAARKGVYPIAPIVSDLIALEEKERIYDTPHIKKKFAAQVENHRHDLKNLLDDLKKQGRRVVGLSAPAKGNTLLNYCSITPRLLDYITEKSPFKIGLHTPGTHIKIEPDEKLLQDMPDYALILAWNFAEEIMKNLNEYKRRGGKFIIPIPSPKIV